MLKGGCYPAKSFTRSWFLGKAGREDEELVWALPVKAGRTSALSRHHLPLT